MVREWYADTPATPKWLPSHFAVNSARVALGKEMERGWQVIGKEMVCKRQHTQNGSPRIYAVNSARVAAGKEMARTW